MSQVAPEKKRRSAVKHYNAFFAGILVLAGALRFFMLGSDSLWYDEAGKVLYCEDISLIPKKMFSDLPLFSFLLALWFKLGKTEFFLRSLSALFGVFSVYALERTARFLLGKRSTLHAIFLFAVAPMAIYASRDLTPYALYIMTAILSFGALTRFMYAMIRNKKVLQAAVPYVLFTSLLLYSHTFACFFLVSQTVILILVSGARRRWRIWATAQILATATLLPWIYYQISMTSSIYSSVESWIPSVSAKRLFRLFKNLLAGYCSPRFGYWVICGVFAVLFFIGLRDLWRKRRNVAYFLLAWIVVPSFMLLVLSLIPGKSVWIARYLTPVLPAILIVVGRGLYRLREERKFPTIVVILICFGFSLYNQYANYFPFYNMYHHPGVYPRKDFSAMTLRIKDKWRLGDGIGHTATISVYPFHYYLKHRLGLNAITCQLDLDGEYLAEFHRLYSKSFFESGEKIYYQGFFPTETERFVSGKKRVWLVCSSWNGAGDGFYNRFRDKMIVWFQDRYYTELKFEIDGVPIYLFDLQKENPDRRARGP